MRLSNERIIYLLQAYADGLANEKEERELFTWLTETGETRLIEELIQDLVRQDAQSGGIPETNGDQAYAKILQLANIEIKATVVKGINRFRFAAAIIVTICTIGLYFILTEEGKLPVCSPQQKAEVVNDAMPGRNGAVLTLANGKRIELDSVSDGELANQGNSSIKKQGGQIIYNATLVHSDSVTYNSISTPAGRQYVVLLADGSKVWLNAASSIRFPTAFVGRERRVSITGEAYFEIAPHASMPFFVGMDNHAEVLVLGTQFNINAYNNESSCRTTLLEGSIRISSGLSKSILRPGQQAMLEKDGKMKIAEHVNTEDAIAWKNGKFQFEGATLDVILRQLARWYDVEIEYGGTISKHFVGTISRSVNLSQVLKMLELTGEVKFTINGKRITAMPA
ncbi:MAG: FecR domain-containing protein [Puia sp.]